MSTTMRRKRSNGDITWSQGHVREAEFLECCNKWLPRDPIDSCVRLPKLVITILVTRKEQEFQVLAGLPHDHDLQQ
jgi:hypothetical protein